MTGVENVGVFIGEKVRLENSLKLYEGGFQILVTVHHERRVKREKTSRCN